MIYVFIVAIGIIAYVLSLFAPLLTINQLYIFSDTLTMISIMHTLLNSGEWVLFMVIVVFAMVLPVLKYSTLLLYGLSMNSRNLATRTLSILETVSRWAMLDVFIIAILVAAIKLKWMASAQTHYGLYLFVLAVLISMVSTYYYKHVLKVQK